MHEQPNQAVIDRIFQAIADFDLPSIESQLHPEFVFELPFKDEPTRRDRAAALEMFAGIPERFSRFDLRLTEVVNSPDGAVISAQYEGDCEAKIRAIPYRNKYAGFFYFRDGHIVLWREYANPIVTNQFLADLQAAV